MEYFRTEDGQIQADLAKRLGIILEQYYKLSTDESKYEVTLTLAILQSLLTNCVELMNGLSRYNKKENPLYKTPIDGRLWGVTEMNIKINTFSSDQLSIGNVIRHMRNAFSHPTKTSFDQLNYTTGYTTIPSSSLAIEEVVITDSPDIDEHNQRRGHTYLKAKKILETGGFPRDVDIYEIRNNKYAFIKDGKPFNRVFQIVVKTNELSQLAFALSNYLSQPINKNWDGRTYVIKKLVA